MINLKFEVLHGVCALGLFIFATNIPHGHPFVYIFDCSMGIFNLFFMAAYAFSKEKEI